MEPIIYRREDAVRMLCEAKADPTVPDKTGRCTPYSLAQVFPSIHQIFIETQREPDFPVGAKVILHSLTKVELNGSNGVVRGSMPSGRVEVELESGKCMSLKAENLKVLELCTACGGSTAKPQRCSGCLRVSYCSKECQNNHWKTHKSECKASTIAGSGASEPDFLVGKKVSLHSLAKVEMNGSRGVVQRALPSGRVEVELETGKSLSLKPENLKVLEACTACGGTATKPQKCSVCLRVSYCSKECQRSHWKTHKSECKAPAIAGSVAVNPAQRVLETQSEGKIPAECIVKVQVPLCDAGLAGFDATKGFSSSALRVYDKARSFDAFVYESEAAYPVLRDCVHKDGHKGKGSNKGLKAYFNARLGDDGKVYVDPSCVLPMQKW